MHFKPNLFESFALHYLGLTTCIVNCHIITLCQPCLGCVLTQGNVARVNELDLREPGVSDVPAQMVLGRRDLALF